MSFEVYFLREGVVAEGTVKNFLYSLMHLLHVSLKGFLLCELFLTRGTGLGSFRVFCGMGLEMANVKVLLSVG
jgi:hypothetical protein